MPDIDIDFADRNQILNIIQHVPAIISDNKKHNTGVYCQPVPINPLTGCSSIDYKQAEDLGYSKLDFLNVSLYQKIKDESHLIRLMNTEPLWDLLEQDDFSNLLFHVNNHGDILQKCRPKNVEQLAAVLAMIRPAKRYLIGKSWDEIFNEVWIKPDNDDYYFKKAHAIAYAVAIVVQMNLICESVSWEFS